MNQFEYNLSFCLAHSILLESKQVEPLNQSWTVACGDPQPPSANDSARAQYEAFLNYGRPVADVFRNDFLPLARDVNTANQDAAFANAERQATFDRDMSTPGGVGSQAVDNTLQLQRQVDPEYFDSRTATSSLLRQLQEMASGTKPIKMSGSEQEEVSRGLARTNQQQGNLGNTSALSTLNNAMTFGQAGENRRNNRLNQVGNAVSASAGTIPTFRSGIDPYMVATGKTSQAPTGVNQAIGLGNNAFGTYGSFQNTFSNLNAQRRDVLDRVNETMSSV